MQISMDGKGRAFDIPCTVIVTNCAFLSFRPTGEILRFLIPWRLAGFGMTKAQIMTIVGMNADIFSIRGVLLATYNVIGVRMFGFISTKGGEK